MDAKSEIQNKKKQIEIRKRKILNFDERSFQHHMFNIGIVIKHISLSLPE